MHELRFALILYGLAWLLRVTAWLHPAFRARLKEMNFTAQIKTYDNSTGRWYEFRDGRVLTGSGIKPNAQATLSFKTARLAANLLTPPINWLDQINALKEFMVKIEGDEKYSNWLAQTMMMTQHIGWKFGIDLPDGTKRYCNMTNGGPVFVYVKDGKIVRMTPIDFSDEDARVVDHRGARGKSSRRRARPPSRRTARTRSRSSTRRTGCFIR